MSNCAHLPDFAGEKCPGCGDEIDEYGNTENDFNSCSFPDCGCDGARLCMAGSASERAIKYNGEGMYHSASPVARMAFAGAFYSGEFDAAQAMSAGTAKTEGLGGDSPASAVRQDAPETPDLSTPLPSGSIER